MSAEGLIKKTIKEFKKDPRNKVFVGFEVLVASASEETGKKINPQDLIKIIKRYLAGKMKSSEEAIYDGAVAACGAIATGCFGKSQDEDVDYSIDWIENDDGTYAAAVRPN